ncbi:MarR family winged helix-turn-helix transcriptional regulator [Streptosporangium lutulentum]|uniref:DNA-binding MarR family transcriptional regulator n=1 Tax=Streptosporangium lutulentum TaxID=1461250 RepID=A0ABT9QID4_9ACTN|nr:MarR family transcriptional regulator [Streptosporangium lutulentum]MDP9846503.1 DNA-binding MarR family transcriptional regulator [Streptosporangium lutulentum]
MPSPTSSPRPLNRDEEAVIRALGRVILVMPRVMDADLMREQRLPLSEYSAMMHLSEAPHRRMRMSELAAACDLSLSGMTRVVTRLETDGLVERVKCEEDARGLNAVLTDAGLARLERAWPTHLASVRRHMVDHLDGMDLARLARALERFGTDAEDPRSPGACA